ncbi:MAG: GNAT family N-acetyltransferase [wastewater metagenome]|nr:GNAT family N-acetyltransferase [Candidatus Loosdrechtia aerotolerans]
MGTKPSILLRPLNNNDIPEYSDMLYSSFNTWYRGHGWRKNYFGCKPQETRIFYDIYNDLTPDCSVAAFSMTTGRMMGVCFYHPREYHVSLGIMSVHPAYWKQGVGRALVNHILKFVQDNDYKSCHIVSSAFNMDSFSLYNRPKFVPRAIYQSMVIAVPEVGINKNVLDDDRVRDANPGDVIKMGDLEMEISGIKREIDYRYAIENPRKVLHELVYENSQDGIDGFMISVKHPALNMLGPCVARTEDIAITLIGKVLNRFRGNSALFLVPMQMRRIVEKMYDWGAINVETYLMQVWGEFQDFKGVNMPSFLPETG